MAIPGPVGDYACRLQGNGANGPVPAHCSLWGTGPEHELIMREELARFKIVAARIVSAELLPRV